MVKIFVSYSRIDEKVARKVSSKLTSLGFDVWFDRTTLKGGEHWESEIIGQIRRADMVVALFSSRSIDRRGFFQAELKETVRVVQTIPSAQRFLVPCRLDHCAIPADIENTHVVDVFPFESGFKRLAEVVIHERKRHEQKSLRSNSDPKRVQLAGASEDELELLQRLNRST